MNRLGFILVALILNLSLYGQTELSGFVIDKKDGTPLTGANVYLPELSKGTVTDDKGYYELKNLPKGDLLITVSFIGYKTAIKRVKTGKKSIQLDFSLEPAVIQSEEVVVSGNFADSQHANSVNISTLKSKTILQSATPSFTGALKQIPGVDVISKGPGINTPVIRGLSTSNILFLNNGIPLQNFQFSVNHPYIIDESGIGKIEVLKGPASLLYGSGAVGGVINIIPEAPLPSGKIKGNAVFKYFTNTSGLNGILGVRGTDKNIIWGIHGNVNSNKDYKDGNNKRVPNSRFNTNGVKADVGIIKKIGTFRLFGEYSNYKLGLTVPSSINKVTDDERKNNIWYQDLNNLLLHSRNKIFIGSTKTDIDISWQQNRRKLNTDYDKPYFNAVNMLLNTLYYSSRTNFNINKDFRFAAGIQGYNQKNKNFHAPDHVLPDATINDVSLFAISKYKKNKLNIEAGVRYTHSIINVPFQINDITFDTVNSLNRKFDNVSFSTGLTYQINTPLLIRFNIASSFRSPNLAELTQNGVHGTRYEKGNPDLKTQRNTEFDAGIHFHNEHATFDISGFYNNISNYIYLSPSNDTTASGFPVYYYRQDQAFLYGGESMIHIHPNPVPWLHFLGKWTYTVGRKKSGDYLPFIPAQKINLELMLKNKKWHSFENSYIKAGTDITFAQNKPSQFETETDGYILINMSMGTDIKLLKQQISIIVSGNNLTNKVYRDHLSTLKPLNINNMGRNISLILKINFGN